MNPSKTSKVEFQLIYGFGLLKLLIHFLTNTRYGLHRDEFLYFEEGKHLAWGYFEVPPMTPFIGYLADLLGGSVFSMRLFPALAGTIIVVLGCKLTKDLGGGKWAIIFTGLSLTFTPVLLGTNALFQPVSFNQLFWFLIAYTIAQMIRDQQAWRWGSLGLLVGLGFLTKYSLAFYLVALFLGVLMTKQRNLLKNKFLLGSIAIALMVISPNLWWQWHHEMPLFQHMQELRETQLVHVDWIHFLNTQIFFHKGFTCVWLMALYGLFRLEKWKAYRCFAWALLLTLLIIGGLQGKAYYTLGAFLILFPFGGLVLEEIISSIKIKFAFLLIVFAFSVPFYPFSIPFLKLESLQKYSQWMSSDLGLNYMLRWEDGKYYSLPQDIADMYGWGELVQRVAKIYHALPPEQKEKCMIYGGSYAHAAAVNFYRKKYQLSEAYSVNSSFIFWAEEEVDFDRQILIDDRKQETSTWFVEMTLVDSIQNPVAREKGYIYYRSDPKIDVAQAWKEYVQEERRNLGL